MVNQFNVFYDKCPICHNELIKTNRFNDMKHCKNGCYRTEEFAGFMSHCFHAPDTNNAKVTIYDRQGREIVEQKKKLINQIIDYWKHEDRYLAEILIKWKRV